MLPFSIFKGTNYKWLIGKGAAFNFKSNFSTIAHWQEIKVTTGSVVQLTLQHLLTKLYSFLFRSFSSNH